MTKIYEALENAKTEVFHGACKISPSRPGVIPSSSTFKLTMQSWKKALFRSGTVDDPSMALRNPYHRLAMELYFDLGASDGGIILMLTCPSSPTPTKKVAMEMAGFLAGQQGRQVLLIDTLYGGSPLSEQFWLDSRNGLLNYLAVEDESPNPAEYIKNTGKERIDFMSHGHVDKGHTWLLNAGRLQQGLEPLRKRYDFILVLCSSVLNDPAALSFPSFVDCVLFLALAGITTKRELKACRRALDRCQVKKTGLLFVHL